MRAKIQGSVWLECVVTPEGVCVDIQVVRSLDPVFGLDEAAVESRQALEVHSGQAAGPGGPGAGDDPAGLRAPVGRARRRETEEGPAAVTTAGPFLLTSDFCTIPPMPPPPGGIADSFFSSGISATSASVVSSSDAIDAAFWRAGPHDLGRVDDAGLDEVLVRLGLGVEAGLGVHLLHALHDDRALDAGVAGDPPQRLFDGPRDDVDADLLVAAELQLRRAPGGRGAGPRRRPGRCPPRRPPWWRASRPRRAPSSPSSRSRWPRRP